MSRACPGNSSILDEFQHLSSLHIQENYDRNIPRFGVGSRSCAGKENLTDAISVTPMNLGSAKSVLFQEKSITKAPFDKLNVLGVGRVTYFRKMLRNVLSFELSSGGLSDAYAVSSDAVFASLAEAVDCGVVLPEDGVAMIRQESFSQR